MASRSPSAAISLPGRSDTSDDEPVFVSETRRGLMRAPITSMVMDSEDDRMIPLPMHPRMSIKGEATRCSSVTSSTSSAAAKPTATGPYARNGPQPPITSTSSSSASAASKPVARKSAAPTSQVQGDRMKERTPVASTSARILRDRSKSKERPRSDVEMALVSDYEPQVNGGQAKGRRQESDDDISNELKSTVAIPRKAPPAVKQNGSKKGKGDRRLRRMGATKPVGSVEENVWALRAEYSKELYLKGELPFTFEYALFEEEEIKDIENLGEAELKTLSRREWMLEQGRRQQRSLQGPELPGEFDYELLRTLHQRPKAFHTDGTLLTTKGDAVLYGQLMSFADASEIPSSAPSRLQEREEHPFHPPFELLYTNRVIYPPTVVPQTTAGCKCSGNCQDEPLCACRLRQALASRTRTWELVDDDDPVKRSGITTFAYDLGGCVKEEVLRSREPIYECGRDCGCDDSCQNRVVGLGFRVPIEIFWTEAKRGWGVRVSPDFDEIVPAGKPLGIYAGLLSADGDDEGDDQSVLGDPDGPDILELIGRNYQFALDFPCAVEAGEEAALKKRLMDAKEQLQESATASMTTSFAGSSATVSVQVAASATAAPPAASFETSYSTDAMHMGSWTRFVNHSCFPTVQPHPVYVEDMAPRRPLLVYVASRDIKPGQELSISYYGEEPKRPRTEKEKRQWKAESEATRRSSNPSAHCFCGNVGCRGVMFKNQVEEAPVLAKARPKVGRKVKAKPTPSRTTRSDPTVNPPAAPPSLSRPGSPSRSRVSYIELPVSPAKGKAL